jgi:hypothetical protein
MINHVVDVCIIMHSDVLPSVTCPLVAQYDFLAARLGLPWSIKEYRIIEIFLSSGALNVLLVRYKL